MSSQARDPHNVPVVFVNAFETVGFLNGVVNLNLLTARFSAIPDGENTKVEPDMIVGARLRMDLQVAMDVYAQLGAIIEANTKGVAQPAAKPN